MRISKIFYILIFAIITNSCGLEKMATKYETVGITTTPPILETHGGKINLSLKISFPQKYFAKKATIILTPVLVYKGGETAFKTITVQGEEASGGESTIFKAQGGDVSYEDHINYNPNMMNANLELRTIAKIKDKEKIFSPKTIAKGVIATSTRVENNEKLANNNHRYEHETILKETATIYFLVNQAKIRMTEKSDADIKKIKEFVKKGYKTHSIEIKSFASPEGNVSTNNDVSDNRMKSTVKYTKQFLRSLKVDGAANNDLYKETSVGEDWKGFKSLITKSNIKDKQRINRIVNSISDVNQREQQIRELAEIYTAIEDNVLPQLRKATIVIRSYEPKKTDQEISSLATTSPELLNVEELLFAATLTDDQETKRNIYNNVVKLYNDWRGYNNIACIYLSNGDLENANTYLDKAIEIGVPQNGMNNISTNRGIIASRKGKITLAQELFNKATPNQHNQAILDIRKGEYAKAARFFKNRKSHNAALAQLLNGKNNKKCNEATASCHYLNAIISIRSAKNNDAINNLKKAIAIDPSYKTEAAIDLEFITLRKEEIFINLTK